jgi:hypothetical protein
MNRTLRALSLCVAALASTPALAQGQEVPREVKSEFRQNIVRRDRMIRELHALDSKAADDVAAGKAPMTKHAGQIELQDQIDLIQLRIETMAVRWNLTIPDPPSPDSAPVDESAATAQRVEAAFQEGRSRADRVLVDRCRNMLASIDYDSFLRRTQ